MYMPYSCPGCGQTDEEKKDCCGGVVEEDAVECEKTDEATSEKNMMKKTNCLKKNLIANNIF